MRIRSLTLAAVACLTPGGGLLFVSLDKETRGFLASVPTDPDVQRCNQQQRDAAFRALDRLPVHAKATRIRPSLTPWALLAGEPLEIPGMDEYMANPVMLC